MASHWLQTTLLLVVTCVAGCGGAEPTTIVRPQQVAPLTLAPVIAVPTPILPFENPGGMWTPEQMAGHEGQLRALGLQIDPKALTDPMAFPLGAVVSLGGCSSSFISAEGLIATNHHCSTRALQRNSTSENNLLRDGFLAKTRADEKWAGPTARIYITQAFRDVTKYVRDGLELISNNLERYKRIEDRTKELIATCEQRRPGRRCSVANYYGDSQFVVIEQLEIRDVRMVYVPAEGIGDFGGEIDNWRWPRHTGDFGFFRAYVGKDGNTADYNKANVPYRPAHYLKPSTSPLKQGDLVLVAGYPAQTNRLRTGAEVETAVSWKYPHQVKFCKEFIALLEELSKKDTQTQIKAQIWIQRLSNRMLKYQGLLDGLDKGGLAKEKVKIEAQLQSFIVSDAGRKAAYGDALEKMARLHAEAQQTREHDSAVEETLSVARLLESALDIVRMAEERAKPDAERDPQYQERNWQRLEQSQQALQSSYHRTIDKGLFKLALERAARLPENERPALLASIVGQKDPTAEVLDQALNAIYTKTKLEDEKERIKLLKTATTASLKKSQDPFIRLALELSPVYKAIEEREKAYHGGMSVVRPKYIEALRLFKGGMMAPDANSTLRITYGTVRGYQPEPDKPVYRPFTVLSEVIQKSTDKVPFHTPSNLLEAARARKFGPYLDQDLNDVPVCFLSDLDITGGNSGSATLNARGELVGLAFDGNYEAMASDWLFMPALTRTIHVDLRYMEWIMDAVDPADHVLQEMGITPSIE